MRHGFWIRNGLLHDAPAAVALAVAAEDGGWDGVFVSDAVSQDHTEPLTLLAAIAARTERVALGTWLTPLIARDVVHVARAVANVDQLSGGRLLVGLGLGNSSEHEVLGVGRLQLGDRLDAALDVLDRLLRGETVTQGDAWLDLRDVSLTARPVQQPRPPLLLGGRWPNRAPAVRAARWDGYLPDWDAVWGDDDGERIEVLRDLVGHYRSVGGDGVIVVPRLESFGAGYDAVCDELGVTWLLHCDDLDAAALLAGPAA